MKMIILCAGFGSRLMPLTKHIPKAMVEYKGRKIIDYTLENAKFYGIDVAVVSGYKSEVLVKYLENDVKVYHNSSYATTNMVSSLMCAREFMEESNEDVIVCYGDIVFSNQVLGKLINSNDDINVVVDKFWQKLWESRMEDPLNDAETLKIIDNKIVELGKKPKNIDEIEGQYIGLFKFSKFILPQILAYYDGLNRNTLYDEKDFNNMYMTSFIQSLINSGFIVNPVYIYGDWVEIDNIEDLKVEMIESCNNNK